MFQAILRPQWSTPDLWPLNTDAQCKLSSRGLMQWKLTFKQLFTNTAVHLTFSIACTSNHNHNFILSIYSVSDLIHCTWSSGLTVHYLHVTYPHVKSFSFSHWKGCPLHCIHWLLNFISYLLTLKDKGHCCTSLPLDQEKSDLTSGGHWQPSIKLAGQQISKG